MTEQGKMYSKGYKYRVDFDAGRPAPLYTVSAGLANEVIADHGPGKITRIFGPYDLTVGLRACFFHPGTMGAMHRGVVREIHQPNPDDPETICVRVAFEMDRGTRWTCPEHNPAR